MTKALNSKFLRDTEKFMRKRAIDTRSMEANAKTPVTELTFLREGGTGIFNFQPVSFRTSKLESPPSELVGTSISAYWLPQGKFIDIPVHNPPCQTLFTGELTGCSVYVHKLNPTTLRVFHVHMSHVKAQHTDVPKGNGGLISSLLFHEYDGGIDKKAAVAVMRYNETGHWHMHYQKIALTPTAGAPVLSVWGHGKKDVC